MLKQAINIAKQALFCYTEAMSTFFENQITYGGLTVYFGNNPAVTEREIHTYHEVIYYVGEELSLLTENGQQRINNNTLLVIPKETYHFFRLEGKREFLRVKISIPEGFIQEASLQSLMAEMKVIEKPAENIMTLLDKLQRILKGQVHEPEAFYAYSVTLLLLAELNLYDLEHSRVNTGETSNMVTRIIDYIGGHLSEDLTIGVLARRINYSPSGVTHCFKKELGVPIHKYITMRRMILAEKLITSGEKITLVPAACGYRDYSSFYKAYTKFFGHPPSEKSRNVHPLLNQATRNML